MVLTAHASVQGAVYGGERSVMLGSDLVLPASLVRDPHLDYVALGHIHKPQDLNLDGHHPVIYPGSIERVDFGEVDDEKFYIIAQVEKGVKTRVEWRKLEGRRFIDRRVTLTSQDEFMEKIFGVLPAQEDLVDAILRLVVEYPFEYENLLDEQALRQYAKSCLEFHFIRRPQRETRLRLPQDQAISSLSPLDLLDIYWRSVNTEPSESEACRNWPAEVIAGSEPVAMIPYKLYLSGFLSYQNPVDLDFSSFELACISGSNGAGKSSLLDAITWALFGEARCRDDDALINSHVNAAEVICDFNYENSLYRVQRSKPRGKTTVLEFYVQTEEGNWRTLTEKTVRDTEARLRQILRMDYDTFINASFFLQGRADQFAQQQPANRKKVLSSVLGLEIWETYRAQAFAQRREVEAEVRWWMPS